LSQRPAATGSSVRQLPMPSDGHGTENFTTPRADSQSHCASIQPPCNAYGVIGKNSFIGVARAFAGTNPIHEHFRGPEVLRGAWVGYATSGVDYLSRIGNQVYFKDSIRVSSKCRWRPTYALTHDQVNSTGEEA